MAEYRSNSNKSKQMTQQAEKKRVESVVAGGAKVKKKGELEKFAGNFISEDAGNIKSYIITDVLVPTIKETAMNVLSMILFGQPGKWTRSASNGRGHTPYKDYYEKDRRPSGGVKTQFSYDELILDDRSDAEVIIDQLDGLVRTYGTASVGDMYDLANISCPYTYHSYGWSSVALARVVPVRDGFLLKMPKPLPIDREER